MAVLRNAPLGTILLAAAATSGLLASAQSTTTYSTSTSWALLDNTDLFPKQTTTPSTTTTTTATDDTTAYEPTSTTTGDGFQITPPIPCPGIYYTYGGICCRGTSLLDCDYDALYDGQQKPSSCCPAGMFVWALPLSEEAIADAQARGEYSGCPGNMRNGVCCSGGVIYQDDGAEVCSLGSVVWVETTGAGGVVGRSSVAAAATSTAVGTTGTRSTTVGRSGAAGATATVMGGGGGSLGGGLAADGRAWWGAVLVGGALGRW